MDVFASEHQRQFLHINAIVPNRKCSDLNARKNRSGSNLVHQDMAGITDQDLISSYGMGHNGQLIAKGTGGHK